VSKFLEAIAFASQAPNEMLSDLMSTDSMSDEVKLRASATGGIVDNFLFSGNLCRSELWRWANPV
jgi:hypothetical protein